MELVWLKKELLSAIVNEYGHREKKTKTQIQQMYTNVTRKLETADSIAFLMIIKPAPGCLIERPHWLHSDAEGRDYPAVTLRGSANRLGAPFKWDQAFGEGDTTSSNYYSGVTSGFLVYKGQTSDGHAIADANDLGFSVGYRGGVQGTANRGPFELAVDFTYSSVEVPIASIVDKEVKSWNNAYVKVSARPAPDSSTPSYSAFREQYSQTSVTDVSREDILQILGLLIGFVSFILELAAL
jgi:hypothetical protein